jgi:hypothetical protein
MKITILAKYNENAPNDINNCITRYQYYAYLIYKHLISYDLIVVNFMRLPPKGTNLINNHYLTTYKINDADHVIIADPKGCYSRSHKFIDKLQESVSGAIVGISNNNIYYSGEDKLFYFDKIVSPRKNTFHIGWLIDKKEIYPNDDGKINILIQKPSNNLHKNMEKYQNMVNSISEFINNNDNTNFEFGIYENNRYHDLLTDEKIFLPNYESKLEIIRRTNIYFITSNSFDREFMLDLGMANAMVVSKKNMVRKDLTKLIDCVFFDKFINWQKIIEKLNNIKSRVNLLSNGVSATNSISNIYSHLVAYTDFRNIEEIKEKNRMKSKFYRTIKKYNDGEITNNTNDENNKEKRFDPKNKYSPSKKSGHKRGGGLRLVQSKLRLK